MDPIITKMLEGVPYNGMGTTLERNALIGVVRGLISQDRYTVDFILSYCESVGYQRKMAEEVFEELTGLSPKLIVNNNEYYKMPAFVPNMCIAWGMSKSNKEKAFYIVPFEYGFAVMEKDEVNAPVPTVISATIPEAFEELKKVAKNIQTLDKIITKKLLETETIPTDAATPHQVNLPYAASPLQVLKKNFKDKVLSGAEFERQAHQLLASEEITVDEAEDLMNWKEELIDEDESYANDTLQLNENWKPLEAEDDEDDYHNSDEYLNSYEYLYSQLVNGNLDLYREKLNKLTKKQLMEYIEWANEMGIGREELKLNKYIQSGKKQASKKIKSELSDSRKKELEEEAQEIISNFDPKAIKVEVGENGGSVLIADNNSDFQAWVDVWIEGNDVNCDWNQYITFINDSKEYRNLQVRNDTETVFDLATSEAIYALEEKGIIVQNDDATWKLGKKSASKKKAPKKVKSSKIIQVNVYDIDWNFDELDEADKPTEKLPDFYNNLNIELDEDAEDYKMTKDDIENMIDDSISEELFNEFGYYPESYNWTYANKKQASSKEKFDEEMKDIDDTINYYSTRLDDFISDYYGDNAAMQSEVDYDFLNSHKQEMFDAWKETFLGDSALDEWQAAEKAYNKIIKNSKKMATKVPPYSEKERQRILDKFQQEYNFLYDHNDNVAGYDEAVDAYEQYRHNTHFMGLVLDLVRKRGDAFSSDREVGALMFALESLGYLDKIDAMTNFKETTTEPIDDTGDENFEPYIIKKEEVEDGTEYLIGDKNSKFLYSITLFDDSGHYGAYFPRTDEKEHMADVLLMSNPGNDKKVMDLIMNKKSASKKKASKKVTAENMDLDDIEAEDNKDQVQDEIEKIEEKPIDEILSENTPEEYFENALSEDKVDTINDVVSRCIDKFSEKFKDFSKYKVQILSYNTKVLGDYEPVQEEMVEDKEINANAILQVILSITNNADENTVKKALAVFSVTNGELHWAGTIRGENDKVVAFTEEGLDALFELDEPSEEEFEDIV